jgi:hypothetical protein
MTEALAPDAARTLLELADLAGEAELDAAADAGHRAGNDATPALAR